VFNLSKKGDTYNYKSRGRKLNNYGLEINQYSTDSNCQILHDKFQYKNLSQKN